MCECFALTTVSIVYSAVGGVATPVKLYNKALPSGSGKNKVPSCAVSVIVWTSGWVVIVKGL